MEKIYDPAAIEVKWRKIWQAQNCFSLDPKSLASTNFTYCIMLPPPNVTGSLHMGHAFQHTIIDLLIRSQRMRGKITLWQPGVDHASISTQMVVEKKLAAQGLKRTDLTRQDFLTKVWEWKAQYGDIIVEQMRRLGTAIAWEKAKFTLDPEFALAVKKVFIALYREGSIYKGQKLINWDPGLQTAISDLEVVTEEVLGKLWYINYPLAAHPDQYLTVATTRPETMFGDVAVCVNPEDQRFNQLIGKQVIVPIMQRKIPIIADHYVDPKFGTGCVKITPAHDLNDYAIAKRHNLPLINIFTKNLELNDNVPESYQGLEKLVARGKILKELETAGLLVKAVDHVMQVPRSTNSGSIVEPFLTSQWFIKMDQLAKPAIAAVESGEIKFVPQEWTNNYLAWLHDLQDWCISRQLWWGHQIPAWYDPAGNIYVGYDLADVRKTYNLSPDLELVQDPDVLDTWFSAALWPFVTLGWPQATLELEKFFPTSVLVTGFDIIFFWVARMVMFSLKFTGQVPFKTVYIHGIIQDADGQKMSKSKGNVIDPIDLIDGISLEKLIAKRTTGLMQPEISDQIIRKTKQQFPKGINSFGTDALRFTFCALATNNRHIKFELAKLAGYRNFCNKLWNAAKFSFMHLAAEEFELNTEVNLAFQGLAGKWIYSLWQKVKLNILKHFDNYRLDLASKEIYEFVWNEYCDWYLEFAKIKLFDQEITTVAIEHRNQIRASLRELLEEILKVLHPMIPYLTEEIWQALLKFKPDAAKLGQQKNYDQSELANNFSQEQEQEQEQDLKLLIDQAYPLPQMELIDEQAEQNLAWIKEFIIAIRNLRAKHNLAVKQHLSVSLISANLSQQHRQYLLAGEVDLKRLAKIANINIVEGSIERSKYLITLVRQTEIFVPIADLEETLVFKKQAQLAELTKEKLKLVAQLDFIKNKLADPAYIQNAPATIVAKEQEKFKELQAKYNNLIQNLMQMQ